MMSDKLQRTSFYSFKVFLKHRVLDTYRSTSEIAECKACAIMMYCWRLSRTLEQCSTKSAEWKNMQPEFVGVQTIICIEFEGLETALTSATLSC